MANFIMYAFVGALLLAYWAVILAVPIVVIATRYIYLTEDRLYSASQAVLTIFKDAGKLTLIVLVCYFAGKFFGPPL